MFAANLKEAFANLAFNPRAKELSDPTAMEVTLSDANGSYTGYKPVRGTQPIPAGGHKPFVGKADGTFNNIMNLTTPMNNVFERTGKTREQTQQEVNLIIGTPGIKYGQGDELEIANRFPSVNMNLRNDIAELTKFCESKKDTQGNPFTDRKFLENCGVCLKNGRDHMEDPDKEHLGGLLLMSNDRTAAEQKARSENRRYPQYRPSVGKCETGYFATDEKSLNRIRNRVACEQRPSYNTPGCVVNYNTEKFIYVDDLSFAGPSLLVAGKGKLLFQNASTATGEAKMIDKVELTLSDNYQQIPIRGYTNSANTSIKLIIANIIGTATEDMSENEKLEISVVVTGPTAMGRFVKDMTPYLMDQVSNRQARFKGFKNYEGYRMTIVRPYPDTQGMAFQFKIPFSFVDPSLPDSVAAGSSAVIATQSDGDDLNRGGSCYKKGQGVGKYGKECVADLFEAAGCTIAGEGHPSVNIQTVDDINAKELEQDKISDKFIEIAKIAKTGTDLGGQAVGIERWNEASMFCLGKEVKDSCAVDNLEEGPLSEGCLIDMYKNQFKGGSVYNTGLANASLSKDGKVDTYCTVFGTESPVDPSGKPRKEIIDKLQTMGGIKNVSAYFNELHAKALDNSLSAGERDQYMMACFGKNADVAKAAGNSATGRYIVVERAPGLNAMGKNRCLTIQQLQVFDTNGLNVAARKSASMSMPGPVPASQAVSGVMPWEWVNNPAVVDSCGDGQSTFTVDLGKDYNLTYITYFNSPRSGFDNSKGMKFKVFDSKKQLVREFVSKHTLAQSFRLIKDGGNFVNDTGLLLKNNIPIMLSCIGPAGKRLYIGTDPRAAMAGNKDVAGTTGVFVSTVPDFMYAMPAMTPNPGESRRLVTFRTPFGGNLRHQGFVMKAHSYEPSSDLYKADATFEVIIPGIRYKAQGTASFRSVNYPDRYLAWERAGDRLTGRLVLTPATQNFPDFIIEPVNLPLEGRDVETYNAQMNGQNYIQTPQQAEQLCQSLGGRLATQAELQAAQKDGASWCSSGWVKAPNGEYKGMWPMQNISKDEFGCGRPYTLSEWVPNNRLANATCVAPKPPASLYNAPNKYFQNAVYGAVGKQSYTGYYSQNDRRDM